MTHKLHAYIDGDGWMVRDNDPETLALFGTDCLPMPFLKDTTDARVVEDVLRTLNPDAVITVEA